MANTFSPFGFKQWSGTGSVPTYEQTVGFIAYNNTQAIFFGDPVSQATGTTGAGTGYIVQSIAPQSLAVTGIVVTNGVAVATFTATTAPAVGSTIVFTGTSFATGGGFNGPFIITASTTTTATFNVTGAYSSTLTFGTATVFTPIAGVFVGCKYLSVSQKRTVWSNYWPGSDVASGNTVEAYVINDPNAQFLVQTANSNTTASAVGLSAIGGNIGIGIGGTANGNTGSNGNTSNGLSTFYADQYTITTPGNSSAGLPFRVVSVPGYSPYGVNPWSGVNGYDITTAYNYIVVAFNNAGLKQLQGI